MSSSFYSVVSNLSKIPTIISFKCRNYSRHNKSTDQIPVSLYNELDLSGELPVYCDTSLISEYQCFTVIVLARLQDLENVIRSCCGGRKYFIYMCRSKGLPVSWLSLQHLVFQKMMNLSLIHFLGSPLHSSHSNIILSPSESLKLYSRESCTELNWSFAFWLEQDQDFPISLAMLAKGMTAI